LWLRTMMQRLVVCIRTMMQQLVESLLPQLTTAWQKHSNISYMHVGRLWRECHGRLTADISVVSFCAPQATTKLLCKWCSFCLANVWSYSRIYTDEAYTESRKKMAVCDESIMWSAYYGFSSGEFCAPQATTKLLCKWFSFCLSHMCFYSQRHYSWDLYW
jgi:hypothetical protein